MTPYGNLLTGSENQYGFTGEWWEDDLELLHLRARWYQPENGIFLSRDAVESEPPYVYVRGNPINYTDPSGHCVPGSCPWDKKPTSMPNLTHFPIPIPSLSLGLPTQPIILYNYTQAQLSTFVLAQPDSSSCGPTSLAMVINLMLAQQGRTGHVSEIDIANAMQMGNKILNYRLDTNVFGEYGATYPHNIANTFNDLNAEATKAGKSHIGTATYTKNNKKLDLINNLQNNVPTIVLFTWSHNSWDGIPAKGAHYVVVIGYDPQTDEFVYLDPDNRSRRRFKRESWTAFSANWSRSFLGIENAMISFN